MLFWKVENELDEAVSRNEGKGLVLPPPSSFDIALLSILSSEKLDGVIDGIGIWGTAGTVGLFDGITLFTASYIFHAND